MSSNRRFGLVIVVACALLYAYGWWHGGGRRAWLAVAIVMLAFTIAMPRVLDPLKRGWLRIGGLLHVVMSPLFLALFYFGGLTPIGLALRLFGKDPLHLRRGSASYWVERTPPGPDGRTMRELY